MPARRRPLRGSRAYWPKKRAKRIYPRIKNWPVSKDVKPLGSAGYKVGMTHVSVVDTNPNSKTKGMLISKAVTVIECPPLSVYGYRIYDNSLCACDVLTESSDKNLIRKLKAPKKKMNLKEAKGTQVRLIVNTNPSFKKKPEVFEVALGGSFDEQLKYAKEILGRKIKISEIFKEGEFIDTIATTTGKGYQGPVKRFGVKLQSRKTEQIHRHTGALGPQQPGKVRYTIPRAGQLGFQSRVELNKRILKFVTPADVIPRGGFVNSYSPINECMLIEGSVTGPKKRLIRLRSALRFTGAKNPADVRYISLESQQGG